MGHTHRYKFCLQKKKNQVKSPSIWSRVPKLGSDPPIGSDRDSGRDIIPRGELTYMGSSKVSISKLNPITTDAAINECETPESNNTLAHRRDSKTYPI